MFAQLRGFDRIGVSQASNVMGDLGPNRTRLSPVVFQQTLGLRHLDPRPLPRRVLLSEILTTSNRCIKQGAMSVSLRS